MTPVESAQIAELLKEIQGMRQDLALLKTQLLGAETTETKHGRIPLLEATQEDQRDRIEHLERWEWMGRGIAGFCGIVAGAVGILYYVTHIARP